MSSNGKIPDFAPASIAMLAISMRSSTGSVSITGPVNSIAAESAPSTPTKPIVWRIKSFPPMSSGSVPV
jgi:hypothetical protein